LVPELSPVPPPSGQAARVLPSGAPGGVVEDFEGGGGVARGQPDRGRVLVQYASLGEYLRWASDRPVLGGFHDRRMIFQDADLFYFPLERRALREGLAAYLERYNVAYVVMTYPYMPEIERRSDLLAPAGIVRAVMHRVYRVKRASGYFAAGSGEVSAGPQSHRRAARSRRRGPRR
jgi:hypothetical protein